MSESAAPNLWESEIYAFNHRALPRPVQFQMGRNEKRILWSFLFIIFATSLAHLPAILEDWNLLQVRNTDVKGLGKIEDIQTVGSGKNSRTLITYSYEHSFQTYKAVGTERHGRHAVGNLVTVYVNSSDPRISHAEFALPEPGDLRLRLIIIFGIDVFVALTIFGVFFLQFRLHKRLMQYGQLALGKVLEIKEGRAKTLMVEYTTASQEKFTQPLLTRDTKYQAGQWVQVLYDPNRPKQVCLYPISSLKLRS